MSDQGPDQGGGQGPAPGHQQAPWGSSYPQPGPGAPYPGGWQPSYPGPSYPGWQPQPQPQPYAAAPVPLPRFPHPEPREYHEMLRTWNYAWWKPVVGILLVALGMVIVAPVALFPVVVVGVALEGGPFWESLERALLMEEVGPVSLLYLNLTLGSAILVTWFVMRVVHRMRPRWLTSVVPKMRWKLLSVFIGLSVVALVAMLAVSILIGMLVPGADDTAMPMEVNELTATTAALALVVLLTTPFQAAGEEYVFRGYLLQAVGSLSGSKWVALLVTSTLFALGHGVQNFPLFFDRFMFGLIAGWLVIRTGGLEAGIAMHILNNFLAFGYSLLFADISSSLNVAEASWWNIPVTLTQAATYAVLVLWVARRTGVQNRTAPPADLRLQPTPAAPGPVPVNH